MSDNPHIGSTFQSFLEEEGIAEEVTAAAIKRVLAWQITEAMKAGHQQKPDGEAMLTSRAYLDRFLDPKNDKVQLDTLQRAAVAVGRRLRLNLLNSLTFNG